jgi:hypothetical protein
MLIVAEMVDSLWGNWRYGREAYVNADVECWYVELELCSRDINEPFCCLRYACPKQFGESREWKRTNAVIGHTVTHSGGNTDRHIQAFWYLSVRYMACRG